MRSHRWILSFAALLLCAAPLLAVETAIETQSLTRDGKIGSPVVTVVDQTSSGLTLTLEVPSVEISDLTLGSRAFRTLALPDGGHRGEGGQPALPVFTQLVALPNGVGAKATLVARDMTRLGSMMLAPNQNIEDNDKTGPVRFDSNWYAAAAPSEASVEIGEPALMHGLRVVPVTFSPVAYDPVSGEVSVARTLTVDVSFTGRDDRNNQTRSRRPIPESFDRIFAAEVIGYERDVNAQVGPGTYIMICPNNATVLNIVEELLDWRRRQGYNVVLATTAQTGTTNTSIKSWLQSQYSTLEPALEFVALVGDATGAVMIPSWREGYSGYGGEGDHEYTLLDGGDVLADVHIGRISVTSTTQLQTVIDKIVDYESAPDMSQTNWFTTAGLTGDPSSSGYSTIWVNQFVKDQLLDLNYTRIDTIWTSNFLTKMMATINQGESIFSYRGYWNMSGMNDGHISSLSNGSQLPYAVVLTCDTGSFWSDTTCRSEAFLRASNGGGIASIGTATLGTHTRYNNCMFLGIMNSVLTSGDQRVGPSLTRGKLNLYKNYNDNEWQKVWIWSTWNNLMGDPATEIFTGVPASISVDYPTQVALGANAIPVYVSLGGSPLEGARVSVYQDGHVIGFAYTDQSGDALMDITGAVNGDVLVTVTGHNLHPHLGATAVGSVSRSLDFASLTIQDTGGNGDGFANPGESMTLTVGLTNHGINSVVGATATLTTTIDGVTVLDGDANYGTVSAGGTVTGTFDVQLASDVTGGETLALRLDASGSGDTWTSVVNLPVRGPAGAFNRLTFGGPGGDLDPGETGTIHFDLNNAGDLATAGVNGMLSCNSQWVTVTDESGNWGAITPGGAAAQSGSFSISIASDCYPGHVANLVVDLAFDEGGTQTIAYPVTIGTAVAGDPTGPDTYGYYAFDNTDTAPEAPTYDWVELAVIGSNTGITDNSRWDDETRNFDLPFPFTYYGETYERVSICSNGWLSFGNTYIKLYRNWALPADGSPDAMVAAFWDDLAQGIVFHWYDSANHRYIVQWDDFGTYTGGSYTGNCTFEVILYDPVYHETPSGDGKVVVQYQAVTVYGDETTYFTTGIQNGTRDDGLTYAYGNNYSGGAAPVMSNRAITFLPVVPQTQGTLSGMVSNNSAGGTPVPDATITVVGAGRQFASASDGHFAGGVPIGNWDIAVSHDSFAPDTTYGVTILEGQTTVVNFSLDDIRGPYIENVTQLDDTENTTVPYVVEANVTDMTGVEYRFLHYTSSANGGPFSLPMTVIDEPTGLVTASIPAQPDGTRVQYWITAGDLVDNTSEAPTGAPWPHYTFMVAQVTDIANDDFESETGWTRNLAGDDDATGGLWERGNPIGTVYNSQQCQSEDDHTPTPGVNCWFTGQHTEGQTAGYNDVDGGQTTLTSPVYNVAGYEVISVSYWRWYTNDLGYSPSEDTWLVQVSNDGGSNWSDVENTMASNNAWQQVSFTLNDYFTTPDQMRLRFRASDYGGGSLVEAAVDDIVISASSVVADTEAPTVTVTAPTAGSQYSNGQTLNVTWNASDDVGVVHARVLLSLDGGLNFDQVLDEGALNGSTSWYVDVPIGPPSYDARVRVDVIDGMERTTSAVSGAFTIEPGTTAANMPGAVLVLAQNQPNPFNPQTVIAFNLPRAQDTGLRVYDLQGKLVRTLVEGTQTAGRHEVTWRGLNDRGGQVASGLYFYRLTTEDGNLVRKMLLLK